MEYIQLGEERISRIAIGCMRISALSDDELSDYVYSALAQGINFFDHADIYGGGECERKFGRLLKKDRTLRERMFIQSKCAIHDGYYDFSKAYILKSVDGILERLGTDHLDSLLLHRPDALMEKEEVSEAFNELYEAGKVRHFGFSNMNRYQLEYLDTCLKQKAELVQLQLSIAHTPLIDASLNMNNLNDNAIMRDAGTLEYCRQQDMVVQTWSPLQKGFFEGTFLNSPEYPELNEVLDQLAEKYAVTADAIAYAWLLRYPARMQVIVGTTRKERMIQAARAAEVKLSRAEWYDLYKAAGNVLP